MVILTKNQRITYQEMDVQHVDMIQLVLNLDLQKKNLLQGQMRFIVGYTLMEKLNM